MMIGVLVDDRAPVVARHLPARRMRGRERGAPGQVVEERLEHLLLLREVGGAPFSISSTWMMGYRTSAHLRNGHAFGTTGRWPVAMRAASFRWATKPLTVNEPHCLDTVPPPSRAASGA
jgi:hypothetical protein